MCEAAAYRSSNNNGLITKAIYQGVAKTGKPPGDDRQDPAGHRPGCGIRQERATGSRRRRAPRTAALETKAQAICKIPVMASTH